MTKLRPMRVTQNQILRILRGSIGAGFFVYKYNDDTVEVCEFMLGPNKELLQTDGAPLEYYLKDGTTVRYRLMACSIKE